MCGEKKQVRELQRLYWQTIFPPTRCQITINNLDQTWKNGPLEKICFRALGLP